MEGKLNWPIGLNTYTKHDGGKRDLVEAPIYYKRSWSVSTTLNVEADYEQQCNLLLEPPLEAKNKILQRQYFTSILRCNFKLKQIDCLSTSEIVTGDKTFFNLIPVVHNMKHCIVVFCLFCFTFLCLYQLHMQNKLAEL